MHLQREVIHEYRQNRSPKAGLSLSKDLSCVKEIKIESVRNNSKVASARNNLKELQQDSFKNIIPVAREILEKDSERSIRRLNIENKAIVSAHFS